MTTRPFTSRVTLVIIPHFRNSATINKVDSVDKTANKFLQWKS